MISPSDLRFCVVRPTLREIGLWSMSAENLLMGTAAAETDLGYYLKQITGPGKSIYSIEDATHSYLVDVWLKKRPELLVKVLAFSSKQPDELIWNLAYATAIARIKYLTIPEKLPPSYDIGSMASYWKQYYNTPGGAGTIERFVKNYQLTI